MPTRNKWRSSHLRKGTWVRAHKRSNGIKVKAYHRRDHKVRGRFSQYYLQQPALIPEPPPQPESSPENQQPHLFDNPDIQSPDPVLPDKHPATIDAVLWTTPDGKTHLAPDNIKIPPHATSVLIMATDADGRNITINQAVPAPLLQQ